MQSALSLPFRHPEKSFPSTLSLARNVIVLLGAGASVNAGIPDFRTPGTGLYSQLSKYNLPYPEAIFDLHYFIKNPKPFQDFILEIWPTGLKYKPTITHYFVKLLDSKNKLKRCYTQNIDSLRVLPD